MFRVGDEVVAVGAPSDLRPWQERKDHNMKCGEVYVVAAVIPFGSWVGLVIAGHPSPSACFAYSWDSVCFRKVQRRDLSAWLSTAVDVPVWDKGAPKRAPAKKRERAS